MGDSTRCECCTELCVYWRRPQSVSWGRAVMRTSSNRLQAVRAMLPGLATAVHDDDLETAVRLLDEVPERLHGAKAVRLTFAL